MDPGCAGAERRARPFGTYLCDYCELSVQIYARIVLIHHDIHLGYVFEAYFDYGFTGFFLHTT